ncbi:uncharacterized protein PG998_005679 [Apiospora kogelbergensis]|uniref:uncharacterized protein n=1 Tax=Apiospora kogelbergensis TaxID=1337665 RepID=UPI003131AD93
MSSPAPAAPGLSLITKDLIIVSAVFPVLSAIAILLRFKARRVTRAGLKSDDWWILATWMFTFGLSVVVWVFAEIMGIDHYKTDVLTGNKNASLCLVVESLLTQFDLTTVKIAILLFYQRVFPVKPFRIAVWVAIAAVSTWGITVFFTILFQGDPRDFIVEGKQEFVLDPIAVGQAQVVGTLVLDFVVLLFPLPMIFGLQMPMKRKIGLALVFWLGLFCCVAALVRVILINRILHDIIDAPSLVYTQATQFIFLLMEPNASIIAACLPCYAPLWGIGKDVFMRSYRSIFSGTDRRNLRSHTDHSRLGDGQSNTASQEHLSHDDPEWRGESQTKTHIRTYDRQSGEDGSIPLENMGKIQVTRGVDVTSK